MVILRFSEPLTAHSLPITAFSVETIDTRNNTTTRTISNITFDENDPSVIILNLAGTPPSLTTCVKITYIDPSGDQALGAIQDRSGNDAASFLARSADTFVTGAANAASQQYQNLILTGAKSINATGNSLDNILIGNLGDNILDGREGADNMAGGEGADTYIIDNIGDIVSEADNSGTDTVQASITYTLGANLENLTLTGSSNLNATGNNLNNTIIGNAGNNNLDGGIGADFMVGGMGDDTYIVDNIGDIVIEATGSGIDTIKSSVSYILSANTENIILIGADNIDASGNAATNILTGNDGNNKLDGGAGADLMIGGLGDDTYVVDNVGDILTESTGAGTDTVLSAISYILGATIEHLILTGNSNINGTGNGYNNRIIGNVGNNTLDGGEGADAMLGDFGDDTYIIDNSGDFITEAVNAGNDTVRSSISQTLGANIENLILTGSAHINAFGNSEKNKLTGNSGDNLLDGGIGADYMEGGYGNDTYAVDNTDDIVIEVANAGTDTIQSTISYVLGTTLENLTLIGSSNINATGNKSNNTLIGNSGNNTMDGGAGDDIIDGGAGADSMIGGAGDDTYVVDNIGDFINETANAGNDTIRSFISYILGSNIENLVLIGNANISGSGNSTNNSLTGNSGNNILDGGAGADYMAGGLGDDTYVIENTNDVIVEAINSGIDTIIASFSYTLGANLENLVLIGNGNFNGTGNSANNSITGNSRNNILDGGVGADTMIGGSGDDTYLVENAGDVTTEAANEGNDTVRSSISYTLSANIEKLILTGSSNINGTGNNANNTINGNAGNNIIDGGAGADTMAAGYGDDTYIVDNVGDVVSESGNEGTDTIQSFISYSLGANLENLILAGSANINGVGNSYNNIIIGNLANNNLDGGAGIDTLDGGGGADTMAGGTGDDTYIVDNTGDVVTELANQGIDTIRASISYSLNSNIENLFLTGIGNISGSGNSSNNTMVGNSGNNKLDGGAGSDSLDGGAGADVMTGGIGDDTYVVDVEGDVVVETINEGYDTVRSSISYILGLNLEQLVLTGNGNINGSGNGADNSITGNAGINNLNGGAGADMIDGGVGADYMAGGLGDDLFVVDNSGDVVLEATNEGNDTVQASTSFTLGSNLENLILIGSADLSGTGNSANNTITGNAGNNKLDGGAGDDVLNGGVGADSMTGGSGDDTYVVDNAGDLITEAANEGTDTVQSSLSYAIGSNIEKLILAGRGNIDGTGNSVNNTIIGNVGNNIIDGGVGADSMAGGLGDDTYFIDNIGDIALEDINAGLDNALSTISYTLAANIENLTLTGGSSNINGTGNYADNTIIGNSGNNIIDGGLGADSMAGGAGNDTYVIDNANDIIIEAANAGIDTINSSISYTLGANLEQLVLAGNDRINGTGNSSNNTITGNANNNTIDGGAGEDLMAGGAGDDSYIVDNVNDIVIEVANAGSDTIQSSISYILGANLENLTLSGSGNIKGTGNSVSNTIIGNAGNNILEGGAGDDSLDGGSGADTMIGGSGDDAYSIDNAADVITESANEGTDTVRSSISYSLGSNLENLTLTGTANISGVGNSANNTIIGNSGNNNLDGGAGADILDGGAGADSMAGGTGDDTYVVDNAGDVILEAANAGTDTLRSSITFSLGSALENLILTGSNNINATGNSVNNIITGNAGSNTLDGGSGADAMAGGAGDDIYVIDQTGDVVTESTNAGNDTVRSSVSYTLGDNLENLSLTGSANINGTGNGLNNIITGNAANNSLDGGSGADSMAGGSGDDTYFVDNAGDTTLETADSGTDSVQASISYTLGSNLENLILSGNSDINGTGNSANNIITGNAGNNIIDGGAGKDILTGLGGTNTFRYSLLSNSLLAGYDRITDFKIGVDSIDSTVAIAATNIRKLGSIASLYESDVQGLLSSANFAANGASIFTFGAGSSIQTYLAINDPTAGFDSRKDAIIEITGYTGSLNNLSTI